MNAQDCLPKFSTTIERPQGRLGLSVSVATQSDREAIYRLRHEVYARELGQHATIPAAKLKDALDCRNIYLVAKQGSQIAGFISLTPPRRTASNGSRRQISPGRASQGARPDFSADKSALNRNAEPHYSIDKYVSREALPFAFDDGLYEVRLLTVVKPHRGREVAT